MIFINAAHRAGGSERLKHSIRPAAVTMLERLNDLQVQVYVNQITDLKAAGISVSVLLPWELSVTEKSQISSGFKSK